MSAEAVSSLLAPGLSCRSVPVEHLDYIFIQNCSDLKYLEQILEVLRSGQEGFYPHLIEFCEKHIEKLDPKSRSLRKQNPPATAACFSAEEWREMEEELQVWEENIRRNEAELNRTRVFCDVINVPPVRCSITVKPEPKPDPKPDLDPAQKTSSTKVRGGKAPSAPRAHTDWDRFDVEKECAKIDESEEKTPDVFIPPAPPIKHSINSTALTDQEKDALAGREKHKGNECFRIGDYEEALVYYTRSLSLVSSVSVYNNRAQTHIRLRLWQEALSDCQTVLQLEPGNVKALLRRATVHQHLGHIQESLADLRTVLLIEPHNLTAKKLLSEFRQTENHQPKAGRKLLIQEVEEEEEYEGDTQSGSTEAGTMHDCEVIRNTHQKPNSGSPNSKSHSTTDRDTESSRELGPAPTGAPPPALTHLKTEGNLLLKIGQCEGAVEKYTQTNSENTATEAQFQLLKTQGRDLIRRGCYQEAAEQYSRCLQLRAQDCAVHTNRALCYIKLERFTEAKQDCDSALQLEPTNLKAFYRRALANKGLGDYLACSSDLQEVLRLDTSVMEAEQLLAEVMLLMKKRKSSPSRPRRSVPITEVEGEDEESHHDDEDQVSAANGLSCPSIGLQPSDAFGFGQTLNATCAHGDLLTCAELLCSVASERLPQYISSQLDGRTISFIIRALNTHLLRSHPHLVYQHLLHLPSAPRFSMVLMLMDSEGRRHLMELFENLSAVQTEAFSQNDVKNLANKYI